MNVSELEQFRSLLEEREINLRDWFDSPGPVTDGDLAKVRHLVGEIRRALGRIEDHTYGICRICQGQVEIHRLQVQPIVEVCLDCISDQEKELLQEELQLASRIHRALLPQHFEKIDGFEIAVKALAARSIGGDYYDVLRNTDNTRARIVVADTMGKGIPAGLLMSNLQGALRVLSQEIDSVSHLVSRLNHWLCRNVPVTKFVSLACIDVPTGKSEVTRLSFANAGHCPGILMGAEGSWECLEPTGAVIGVHEAFEYEEGERDMYPGDILVLFTDGLTEAANASEVQFEQDRVVKSLQRHRYASAEDIITGLIDDVTRFTGSSTFEDDLTIIVLKKQG